MTLAEFIACVRSDLQDESTPYLWTDDELVSYTNDSLNVLARPEHQDGAHYFYDTTTWAAIAITADDPDVPDTNSDLSKLLSVRRATVASTTRPLDVFDMDTFQSKLLYEDYGVRSAVQNTTWEETTGVPLVLLTDYLEQGLRLYPIPSATTTLKLWAYRMPITPLIAPSTTTSEGDWKTSVGQLVGSTQIEDDEKTLRLGVKAFAFAEKHDADAYDANMAEREMGRFLEAVRNVSKRLRLRRYGHRPVRVNRDYAY